MASSLCFDPCVRDFIPHEMIDRLKIIPFSLKNGKLCLIARRPLTNEALLELKMVTGIEDYELQLVGEDVLYAYIDLFKDGGIYSFLP